MRDDIAVKKRTVRSRFYAVATDVNPVRCSMDQLPMSDPRDSSTLAEVLSMLMIVDAHSMELTGC